MTDIDTTQPPPETESPDSSDGYKSLDEIKRDIVVEVEQIAGNPDEAITKLEGWFNEAYQLVEEDSDEATQLIEAWDNITAIYNGSVALVDIGTTAKALAQDLRDKLKVQDEASQATRTALNNLRYAMYRADTTHPEVQQLSERIYEEIVEGGAYVSICPACEICHTLGLDPSDSAEHAIAEEFHELITCMDGASDLLTDDETNILNAFMHSFIAKHRNRIAKDATQSA